jgi:hypothetical protein
MQRFGFAGNALVYSCWKCNGLRGRKSSDEESLKMQWFKLLQSSGCKFSNRDPLKVQQVASRAVVVAAENCSSKSIHCKAAELERLQIQWVRSL